MRTNLWCVLCTGLILTVTGCEPTASDTMTTSAPHNAKMGAWQPGDGGLTSGFGSDAWGLASGRQTIELEGQLSYDSGDLALRGEMEATLQISGSTCKSSTSKPITGSGSVEDDGAYFASLTTTSLAINGGTTGLCGGLGGGSMTVTLAQEASDEGCDAYCGSDDDCYDVCTVDAAWIVATATPARSALVRLDSSTQSLQLDLIFDHLEDADGETVEE